MSTPVYIRNLPPTTTEIQLRRLFWGFGRVRSVSIRQTDATHAEGSVDLASEQAASTVALVLQGSHLGNRTLDVSITRPEADEASWDGRSGGLSSQVHDRS